MSDMQEIVDKQLDASKENGYFEPGQLLDGCSPLEVAHYMVAFCDGEALIYDMEAHELVEYIEDWARRNQ